MGKRETVFYFYFLRSSHKSLTAGHANGATEYAQQPVNYMLSVQENQNKTTQRYVKR